MLNDLELYSEIDQGGMAKLLMQFYQQFDTGVELARKVDLTAFAGYEIYNILPVSYTHLTLPTICSV